MVRVPQLAGLGRSPTARHYAIGSLEEAGAYLDHPLLGVRLRECAGVLCRLQERSAEEIFGGLDAHKLRSSMTLFMRARPQEAIFGQLIDRYFAGTPDSATDELLGS